MTNVIVDILRLGFPGLAGYCLYLAFKLTKQIIELPTIDKNSATLLIEKRRTLHVYLLMCGLALIFSFSFEAAKYFIKPIDPWVNASFAATLSDEDLRQRPLEIYAFFPSDPDEKRKGQPLTNKPTHFQIPSSGGMVLISVPQKSESKFAQ
jgi:hypothetical protein